MAFHSRRWTRQPQAVAGFQPGAVFAYLPSIGDCDLLGDVQIGPRNGLRDELTAHGVGVATAATNERFSFDLPQHLRLQEFTLLWAGIPQATNKTNGNLIGSFTTATASSSPFVYWTLRRSDLNSSKVGASWNNGTFRSIESAAGVLNFGALNVLAMTHGGGRLQVWANGAAVIDTTSSVSTISYVGSAPTANVAGQYGDNSPNVSTLLAVIFNRVLTERELSEVTLNPWAALQPSRIWVPQAAGLGGVTGASAGTLPVAATSAGAVAVSGLSSQAISLEGASTATAPIAGASAATVALVAASAGQSLIAGASAGTVDLAGSAAGTTTGAVSGESAQTISLAGASAGQVLVSSASSATVTMTGSATGAASGAGVIGQSVGQIILAGNGAAQIIVGGTSASDFSLAGLVEASVAVVGISSATITMAGAGSGTTTGAAGQDEQYPLAGLREAWPLAGEGQSWPLAGQQQAYPLR